MRVMVESKARNACSRRSECWSLIISRSASRKSSSLHSAVVQTFDKADNTRISWYFCLQALLRLDVSFVLQAERRGGGPRSARAGVATTGSARFRPTTSISETIPATLIDPPSQSLCSSTFCHSKVSPSVFDTFSVHLVA